jgi:MoaA/NifB/PqqE/SkfB family radical SAM enzyme
MKSVAIEHYHPENDKRLKVEWNLTRRCNFDCTYCSKYTHDNFSEWKDLKQYKEVINKLVRCTDKELWVSLTGGEPCIYPHLMELVKYCKDSGVHYLSLCSNGSRSIEYYLKLMKYLDNIIISYHFETTIDRLSPILALRKYIEDTKKTMHVHVMMLPGHFDQAKEVIKILKENDVLFAIRRIRPLYMSDGSVAKPYQKGGDLKLTKNGPDYSDDTGYYSDDELDFFKRGLHEYI